MATISNLDQGHSVLRRFQKPDWRGSNRLLQNKMIIQIRGRCEMGWNLLKLHKCAFSLMGAGFTAAVFSAMIILRTARHKSRFKSACRERIKCVRGGLHTGCLPFKWLEVKRRISERSSRETGDGDEPRTPMHRGLNRSVTQLMCNHGKVMSH